jgi:chaperonin cofactor prefoldin
MTGKLALGALATLFLAPSLALAQGRDRDGPGHFRGHDRPGFEARDQQQPPWMNAIRRLAHKVEQLEKHVKALAEHQKKVQAFGQAVRRRMMQQHAGKGGQPGMQRGPAGRGGPGMGAGPGSRGGPGMRGQLGRQGFRGGPQARGPQAGPQVRMRRHMALRGRQHAQARKQCCPNCCPSCGKKGQKADPIRRKADPVRKQALKKKYALKKKAQKRQAKPQGPAAGRSALRQTDVMARHKHLATENARLKAEVRKLQAQLKRLAAQLKRTQI